ncbi:MAG: GAF domain-containing protein [Anaerolineae bacterium]|nr:GAF domain-containing protein [Anaerolineae bacterium]
MKIAAVSDALRQWREKSVQLVLRFLAIVGIVGVPALIFVVQGRMIGIYLAAYGVILLLAFWKRVPYFVKAMVLLTLFYGLGLVSFVEFARGGAGIIFLLAFVVMAMLLLGHVVGLGALALSLFSIVACGWAFSTGRWIVSTEALYSNTTFSMWLSVALVFLLLGGLLLRFQATLFASLEVVLYDMHQLTRQVNAARTELERRVLERTRDLERRARYLQATSDVAHEATQMVADSQALLQHVVNLVSEQFGFYHAGIFLLDRTGEWAELQAASSAGGQRMLARQHRLRIGEQGTVGYVAAQGVPRVVSDVTDDMVFYNNPDLPETRSAVSLPLHARGEIIGVLDVQSKEVAAFSDEDAEVLQALADQVAIAISNAYLFQQVQQSAEAERRTRGELAREAWRELLRTEPNMGFLSDPHGTTPVSGDEWDAEMIEALNTGVPVKGEEAVALALPIRSRGQVVGVIDAHLPAETREWTSEQVSLLEALAAQVGTALESAQLYRETQRRATRERLTREITDALQRAVDMESLMRIAAEELNRNLRGSRAYVRLDVTSPETGAEQTLEGDEDATTE